MSRTGTGPPEDSPGPAIGAVEGSRMRVADLHRTVKAAGWVSLCTDFSSEMIYPLLPLFLKSVLLSGTAFIGLIEGLAESTASLLKIVSGRMSDRWRKRKALVLAGYTLSSLARPFVAAAGAGWHVLGLRLADRIGKGIRASPRDALIADSTPAEARGLAFGFQRAMDHMGAVIGPLVGAGLLWAFRYWGSWDEETRLRVVFAAAAVPGLLVPVIIWRYIDDAPRAPAGSAERTPVRARGLGKRYGFFLVTVLVFTLGNSSDAFLILRAQESGIPAWQAPLLWAAFHVVKAWSSTPGGRLSDRLGRKTVLLAGWLIYMVSYVLFAFVTRGWQVWAVFLCYGLYYGCAEGTERAVVADLVPHELRGTAYGVFHAAVGIAALPASLVFGAIWQWTGSARPAFLTGAGLAAIAALALAFVPIPRPRDGRR